MDGSAVHVKRRAEMYGLVGVHVLTIAAYSSSLLRAMI